MPRFTASALLVVCVFSLTLLFSSAGRAKEVRYWCAPNAPTDFDWQHKVIIPEMMQVVIDQARRTIREEDGAGNLTVEFVDGRKTDTSDPHVGLGDRVYFQPDLITGLQEEITSTGTRPHSGAGFGFNPSIPAVVVARFDGSTVVSLYCAQNKARALYKTVAARVAQCTASVAKGKAMSQCVSACIGQGIAASRCQCGEYEPIDACQRELAMNPLQSFAPPSKASKTPTLDNRAISPSSKDTVSPPTQAAPEPYPEWLEKAKTALLVAAAGIIVLAAIAWPVLRSRYPHRSRFETLQQMLIPVKLLITGAFETTNRTMMISASLLSLAINAFFWFVFLLVAEVMWGLFFHTNVLSIILTLFLILSGAMLIQQTFKYLVVIRHALFEGWRPDRPRRREF